MKKSFNLNPAYNNFTESGDWKYCGPIRQEAARRKRWVCGFHAVIIRQSPVVVVSMSTFSRCGFRNCLDTSAEAKSNDLGVATAAWHRGMKVWQIRPHW